MYTENPARDALLFIRAVVTNQLARFLPALYVAGTGQTGRGRADTDPALVAAYYHDCTLEYLQHLAIPLDQAEASFADKSILEYGPGDTLGVALLLYAFGAREVHCVDRFPLKKADSDNIAIYDRLLGLLQGDQLARARSAFVVNGDPRSGFAPEAIRYQVTDNGLSGQAERYDLILSRSVLEHVNDLPATLRDTARALKANGISVHKVDLKSHGLDRYRTLDFLTWPAAVYRLMYSAKGFPNRHRLDVYRRVVAEIGLRLSRLELADRAAAEDVAFIYRYLPPEFQRAGEDDLRALSFWMVLEPGATAAAPA